MIHELYVTRPAASRSERRRAGSPSSLLTRGVLLSLLMTAAACGGDAPSTIGTELDWSYTRVYATGSQAMNSVVAGGPGLVAVGHSGEDPAVWTSVDGSEWSRVADVGSGGEGWSHSMEAVIVGGPGLVAVGSSRAGGGLSGVDLFGIWTSADGSVWSWVAPMWGGEEHNGLNAVTAWGAGLIAVGFSHSDAMVMSSVDGSAWSAVNPSDESVFGGPGRQRMNSVVAGGPGLVAVGSDTPTDDSFGADQTAAVWTSVDGIAWSRVPGSDAFEPGTSMSSIVAAGPGLVAVGFHQRSGADTEAAVWMSSDGVAWTRVPPDRKIFSGSGSQNMRAVAVGGSGMIAVGQDWPPDSPPGVAVWESVDGLVWFRVRDDDGVFRGADRLEMRSVTAAIVSGESRLVGVGADYSQSVEDAAVWVGQPRH